MAYIGLISDTHGFFDDKLKKFLEPVDEIWHAGDFGSIELADEIAKFKPLRGVYGNIDGGVMRRAYNEFSFFECEGKRILITHIGGYPRHYSPQAVRMIQS
jgi:predicted phosphodiesterase